MELVSAWTDGQVGTDEMDRNGEMAKCGRCADGEMSGFKGPHAVLADGGGLR